MTYSIEVSLDTGIVKVTYSSVVSLDDRKRAVSEVLVTGVARPFKVLVDVCELDMGLSIEEQKTFGRFLAATSELADAKVAVLHPARHNPNLIIDAIAFTQGYLLAEFTEQNEAVSWLLGD